MAQLETVKVERKDSDKGYSIINKSDFDPKKHKEYSEKKETPKKKKTTSKKSK